METGPGHDGGSNLLRAPGRTEWLGKIGSKTATWRERAVLLASVVTVHYLAGRRDFFYVEGIPKLRRQGFIRKLEKFLCPAPAAAINGAA